MKKFVLTIIILSAAGNAAAQGGFGVAALSPSQDASIAFGERRRSVDEPRIFDARFDSIARNPVEYRRLLDKFTKGVERPSVNESTIIYYGFAMQDGYSPQIAGEADMQSAVMAGDFGTAYTLGCRVLELSPVNLTALYWTLAAATEIKEPWEVRNSLRARYNAISFVISRSGDGKTPETALKTIYTGDMYTYTTQELGLSIGEGYLWDGRVTQFDVTPSKLFMSNSIFFELFNAKN
jgi:hypothetical protein